jgi:hypothetical protein
MVLPLAPNIRNSPNEDLLIPPIKILDERGVTPIEKINLIWHEIRSSMFRRESNPFVSGPLAQAAQKHRPASPRKQADAW